MLFHVGALWRLNELGWLPRLDRISSVSGGAIAAAQLAMSWSALKFETNIATRFVPAVVEPLRRLASTDIDAEAIAAGLMGPRRIATCVAAAYSEMLFEATTLQNLPETPRFVFIATNLQSGVSWRFSRPYMADFRVGRVNSPTLPLATAVAASSAFPPFLSPLRLSLNDFVFEQPTFEDLHFPPFTQTALLIDGGVYDNFGLETAWKRFLTILVSDGGAVMQPNPTPGTDWIRQGRRVVDIIDNQVRSLRVRRLIDSYKSGIRRGAYWGIRTNIASYGLSDAIGYSHERSLRLAAIPTRLAALRTDTQERIINWGYAVCDAAMRRYVESSPIAPSLPYPSSEP